MEGSDGSLEQVWAAIDRCFHAHQNPLRMAQAKAWIEVEYPGLFDPDVVYSQIRGSCADIKSSYTRGDRKGTPKTLSYSRDTRHYTLTNLVRKYPDTSGSVAGVLESNLRDYLAKNLHLLELGLSLWAKNAIEFSVGSRRIDILAKDEEGVPVIIELKLSHGHEKVIGQALLYRAKLKSLLTVSRVRLMLVASEISNDLRDACTEVPDVLLFEYQLAMQLKKISDPAPPK